MINLLIIEDQEAQIEAYKDNIELFNNNNEYKINPIIFNNFEDGFEALKNPDYDAAIIDLKLFPGDTAAVGNQLVREIRTNLRIPVVIISGYPEDLEEDLREETPFLKTCNKDDDYQEIFKEISLIYSTGITNILGKKGHIEKYLNDIFWKHLSSTIDYWKREASDEENLEKIILRYTLSHLQEHLDLSETQDDFENYYPIEMYVTPPIKKNFFTGDIIQNKDDGTYWIIMNPSCDMAQAKAKSVTLAFIEDIKNSYVINLINEINKKDENSVNSQLELNKLLRNSGSLKYHFLPATDSVPGGFINFQKIISVKYKDLDKMFSRKASITDRFSKEIIARFSHYYSRQGQPDFNTTRILEEIIKV